MSFEKIKTEEKITAKTINEKNDVVKHKRS